MATKITLILLAIVALQKVNSVPTVGVEGGDEVIPHSKPYQVGMYIPIYGGYTTFCAGALITPQTVLSAANCFEKVNGPVEVILGAHDVRNEEDTQVRVNATDIISHKKWNKSPLFDIAVVRLPEPVELNDNIQPIDVSKDTETDYIGKKLTVSGWGYINSYIRELAPALRAVELPVVDNFACEIPYIGDVDETTLCLSGANGKAVCNLDSGDPTVIDDVLVGIVSMKNNFLCDEGWPSANVRVSSYVDWIEENAI